MRATPFTSAGDLIRWLDLPGDPGDLPDAGDAAALPVRIYLHGLGGTSTAIFTHIAPHPALPRRRSLLVDLPGHGLSDRPMDFGYTLDEHAAAVAALMDSEGIAGADVIGHSMGGSIAIVLAARRPDLVVRLVVAEANLDPLPPSPTGLGSQQISSFSEDEWVAAGCAERIASDRGWASTLRLCDPRAVHRSAVGLITGSRPTMRELLVALPIPRTFIRGTHGEALRDRAGLEEAGVRVEEIPDASHMMMLDQPDAFAWALAGALA